VAQCPFWASPTLRSLGGKIGAHENNSALDIDVSAPQSAKVLTVMVPVECLCLVLCKSAVNESVLFNSCSRLKLRSLFLLVHRLEDQ